MRSMELRKYLRFSLRSGLLVVTLLCIVAGYSGMCARRNAMLTELLKRNSHFDTSPRLGGLSVRVFPCASSPPGLNEMETEAWNARRPWWQHYVTWPVIEQAEVLFWAKGTYSPGEDEWNQRLRPLLESLDVEGEFVCGDAVNDNAISVATKLPITSLYLYDTELLTTKSLETIRANPHIKELDVQPARFTTAELAPLRNSRKWRSFFMPAIDESKAP